jgi:hypothetical protein
MSGGDEMKQNFKDEIAKLAYELYEKSGYIEGREIENWLEAERIVMERYAASETAETVPGKKKRQTRRTTSGKSKTKKENIKTSTTAKKKR